MDYDEAVCWLANWDRSKGRPFKGGGVKPTAGKWRYVFTYAGFSTWGPLVPTPEEAHVGRRQAVIDLAEALRADADADAACERRRAERVPGPCSGT